MGLPRGLFTDIKEFIESTITYEGSEIIKFSQNYKTKVIDVYLIGGLVPKERIREWSKALKRNERLVDVTLKVHQGSDRSSEMTAQLSSQVKSDILEDLYINNQDVLTNKNEQIHLLEQELMRLKTVNIPFETLSKEVSINYEDIQRFGYASILGTNFENQSIDTIPTFLVAWKPSITEENRMIGEGKLSKWLKLKFQLDTLAIKPYYQTIDYLFCLFFLVQCRTNFFKKI